MGKNDGNYNTASPDRYLLLKDFAIKNKQFPTEAEMLLWQHIRAGRLSVKFNRQHIIGDYIVDFVGRPEKDPEQFRRFNDAPADVMLRIARQKKVKAMGMIGGVLGPKSFVEGKKRIIEKLKASGIRTEYVSPTLVYGNGRNDSMSRMVPLLKFFGIFSKNMRPVHVNDVADELVRKMIGE